MNFVQFNCWSQPWMPRPTAPLATPPAWASEPACEQVELSAPAQQEIKRQAAPAGQLSQRIEKALGDNDDDAVCELSEDDECMESASPEQKIRMIKQLMAGHTNDKEDRAIVSILQSCASPEEFLQVVDGAGGKAVGEELDDDEARLKYDHLVGAYDRLDLALNSAEAEKCRGALTDPARLQRLAGGADSDPEEGDEFPETGDPADDFMRAQQSRLKAQAGKLDRRALVDSVCENAVREKEGKPLFRPRQVRKEALEIMREDGLTQEQRDSKLKQLQQKYGLSDYTMRNLVTQPMARLFERAQQEATQFAQQESAQLAHEADQMKRVFGEGSPEAAEALSKLQAFQKKMAPYLKKLESSAKSLNDMFPPPKSFWDSVGGFLGGLLQALAPALLNLIPGVGSVLYGAYQAVSGVLSAARGDLMGLVTGLAGALPGVGSLLGGATQKLLDTGARVAKGAMGLGQAVANGDPLSAIGAASGLAGDLGAPALVEKVGQVAQKGIATVGSLAEGNVQAALAGATGLAGDLGAPGQVRTVGGYVSQGLAAVESAVEGDWQSGLAQANGLARDLGAPPALCRALGQGGQMIGQLAGGQPLAALAQGAGLASGLGAFRSVPWLEQALA
ncbi:MAG: hypothetical protein U0931_11510 [Vulcanimicrobiota bacterium]